jgi:hypothetical protein
VSELVLEVLARLDVVFASGTVLIAFSLFAYLSFHNFGNRVARAFVIVLGLLTVVYVGDVFLVTARLSALDAAAGSWLRLQWLGIAFVAPAYLYFTHRVLATMGDQSRPRVLVVGVGAAVGVLTCVAVLKTQTVVRGVVGTPGVLRFDPGPLFPVFAGFFLLLTAWGGWNMWRARERALTARSRRRAAYMLVSVLAPLSVFPFLVSGAESLAVQPFLFRGLVVLGNAAAATMLVVVAYAVAYQGALTPERHVKREMLKYLIQVPTLGVWIIFLIQLVPERLEGRLGLPRDVVTAMAIVAGVVLFRFVTDAMKPILDRLVYGRGGRDAMWLRRLDERLLTDQDLNQLLENILTALCDLVRVRSGFVLVMRDHRLALDAVAGPPELAVEFLEHLTPDAISELTGQNDVTRVDGYHVYALSPHDSLGTLGLLALSDPGRSLSERETAATRELLDGAVRALEDRVVQSRVLGALRDLEPALEGLQLLRGRLEPGTAAMGAIESNPIYAPDFPHWVKDALSDYWGGPRLTDSPLMSLGIVRAALEVPGASPAKAMRNVIDAGLERLKPEGDRSMTGYEWLTYNILELRFVRGLRVRDLAARLGLSESDLYRKQRVAIDALARQLAAMEADRASSERGSLAGRGAAEAQ